MLEPRTSTPVGEFIHGAPYEQPEPKPEPEPVKPYAFIKRPEGMRWAEWQIYERFSFSLIRQQRNAQGERCALTRGKETLEGREILRVC